LIGRKRRFTPVSSLALNSGAATILGLLILFSGLAQAQTLPQPTPTLTPTPSAYGLLDVPQSLFNGSKRVYDYILPYEPFGRFKTPQDLAVTSKAKPTPQPTWDGVPPTAAPPTPTPTFMPTATAMYTDASTPVPTNTPVPVVARPGGSYGPLGPATISRAVFVNWVNEFPRSAARGEAGAMYDALIATGTDPAIFAGFAVHESTVATYGASVPNRNIVNISCMFSPCAGRWQIFPSFAAGTRAWGQLMHKYATGEICGRPKVTLDEILYCYAPAFENPTARYITQVKALANNLRSR